MRELTPARAVISERVWRSEWGMHLPVKLVFVEKASDKVYIFPKGHPKIICRGWNRVLNEEICVEEEELKLIGSVEYVTGELDGLLEFCRKQPGTRARPRPF